MNKANFFMVLFLVLKVVFGNYGAFTQLQLVVQGGLPPVVACCDLVLAAKLIVKYFFF